MHISKQLSIWWRHFGVWNQTVQRGILGFWASQDLWNCILYFINTFGAGPWTQEIFLSSSSGNEPLALTKSYLGINWSETMMISSFFLFLNLFCHHFQESWSRASNYLATWVPFSYRILIQLLVPQQQVFSSPNMYVLVPAFFMAAGTLVKENSGRDCCCRKQWHVASFTTLAGCCPLVCYHIHLF